MTDDPFQTAPDRSPAPAAPEDNQYENVNFGATTPPPPEPQPETAEAKESTKKSKKKRNKSKKSERSEDKSKKSKESAKKSKESVKPSEMSKVSEVKNEDNTKRTDAPDENSKAATLQSQEPDASKIGKTEDNPPSQFTERPKIVEEDPEDIKGTVRVPEEVAKFAKKQLSRSGGFCCCFVFSAIVLILFGTGLTVGAAMFLMHSCFGFCYDIFKE